MSWLRIDDQLHAHPKVIACGHGPLGAWLRMASWCAAQLTDGAIPTAVAKSMASPRELARLVEVRLLDVTADGYAIHDYLSFNPTREEVLAERERGRERAAASFRRRRSSAEDSAKNGRSVGEASPALHLTRPDPVPSRPEAPPVLLESADAVASAPQPTPRSRRKPETPAPGSDAATEDVESWCREWGVPIGDPEAANFLDHARREDRRCRDWAAAWRMWQRRALQFAPRGPRGPGGQPADPDAPWLKS